MFGMNLRLYRKEKGFTQEDIANKLNYLLNENYAKINVGKWETGTNPKIKTIIALAEILDIPEQYLFDDSQEKINLMINKSLPNFKEVTTSTKKIPLLDGYVGAGSAGIVDNKEIVDYLFIDINFINKSFRNKKIKAIEVIGDSMSPYVDSSDIILFNPLEKGQYNLTDGKYIIETINGIMLKNLSFKTNGNIIISSTNPAYPPEEINKNESQEHLDIIGVVAGRILKS